MCVCVRFESIRLTIALVVVVVFKNNRKEERKKMRPLKKQFAPDNTDIKSDHNRS